MTFGDYLGGVLGLAAVAVPIGLAAVRLRARPAAGLVAGAGPPGRGRHRRLDPHRPAAAPRRRRDPRAASSSSSPRSRSASAFTWRPGCGRHRRRPRAAAPPAPDDPDRCTSSSPSPPPPSSAPTGRPASRTSGPGGCSPSTRSGTTARSRRGSPRPGSVWALHFTDPLYLNWFYPQNSELAARRRRSALFDRDLLSPLVNFGWLGVALLAAWCIGRPYGVAPLSLVAVALDPRHRARWSRARRAPRPTTSPRSRCCSRPRRS